MSVCKVAASKLRHGSYATKSFCSRTLTGITDPQRVQLECHCGIRSRTAYHLVFSAFNSIMALCLDPLGHRSQVSGCPGRPDPLHAEGPSYLKQCGLFHVAAQYGWNQLRWSPLNALFLM